MQSHKPLFVKIYIALGAFVIFGLIVFFASILLTSAGYVLPQNSLWANLLFKFLEVWGIVFAYILPVGLINVGIWSILYKESLVREPEATRNYQVFKDLTSKSKTYTPVIKLQGKSAVVAGVIYLILGLVLAWGVTGVLLGIICKSPACLNLPKFIKFF